MMTQKENKYCLSLDLGFTVGTEILNTLKIDQSKVNHNVVQHVDPVLNDFLKKMNISVPLVDVFYTPPGAMLPAHVDGDVIDNHCKLNFIFGGRNSVMQWWEHKDKNQPLTYFMSGVGTKYIRIYVDDCNLMWESNLGPCALVNVGQPHSIVNPGDEIRWCLSYVLHDMNTGQLLDWDHALKLFSPYMSKTPSLPQ